MPRQAQSEENESVRSQSRKRSVGGQAEDSTQREGQGRFRKPADELEKLARALRFTGDQVKGPFSGPITRTADGMENAAQRLRDATTQEVVQAIEGFARRRPVAFLGVAALVGFGGSRFFKSSAASRSAS